LSQAITVAKRVILSLGLGILTSTLVIGAPLESNSTRIEYYATVGEPPRELSYGKSRLDFCDDSSGFGDNALLGELINMGQYLIAVINVEDISQCALVLPR
ncbi:hypothetical protein MKX03_011754, partial [Papaver bracteatum]